MASHASSLPPTNNQNQQYNALLEFRAGVTACLISWSALRTAVESGWGGGERESQKKAEDLRSHIFSAMDGRFPLPNFDAFELADNLAIYIEEEFSVTLEDESERQLAEFIFHMYEHCLKGDPTSARQMIAQAASAVALNSNYPVRVQTTEHDDDDDDDKMAGPTNDTAGIQSPPQQLIQNPMAPLNLAEYVDRPMFGKPKKQNNFAAKPVRQLGETSADTGNAVEMDDDGFAPVKKGNRRRP